MEELAKELEFLNYCVIGLGVVLAIGAYFLYFKKKK